MVEAFRGNIVCPNKHVRYATIHAYYSVTRSSLRRNCVSHAHLSACTNNVQVAFALPGGQS